MFIDYFKTHKHDQVSSLLGTLGLFAACQSVHQEPSVDGVMGKSGVGGVAKLYKGFFWGCCGEALGAYPL